MFFDVCSVLMFKRQALGNNYVQPKIDGEFLMKNEEKEKEKNIKKRLFQRNVSMSYHTNAGTQT